MLAHLSGKRFVTGHPAVVSKAHRSHKLHPMQATLHRNGSNGGRQRTAAAVAPATLARGTLRKTSKPPGEELTSLQATPATAWRQQYEHEYQPSAWNERVAVSPMTVNFPVSRRLLAGERRRDWLQNPQRQAFPDIKQPWEDLALTALTAMTAVGVVLALPGVKVGSMEKLRKHLQGLSKAMGCSWLCAAQLAVLKPMMLQVPAALLAAKHKRVTEYVAGVSSWKAQYKGMHTLEAAPLLASISEPKYMRLKYLSAHKDQQDRHMLDVLQMSDAQFADYYPGYDNWAEWHTPSYMFENYEAKWFDR